MLEVGLVLPLISGQFHFRGVLDDDIVSRIDCELVERLINELRTLTRRIVRRLVLADQDVRYPRCQTTEDAVFA